MSEEQVVKRCRRCDEDKPLSDFSKRSSSSDGLQPYCKDCHRSHQSKYTLKTKFGITEEDYARMFKEQNGKCAICLNEPKQRRLAVDHDHKTGKVRGLLCASCNVNLAAVERIHAHIRRRMVTYLDDHKS